MRTSATRWAICLSLLAASALLAPVLLVATGCGGQSTPGINAILGSQVSDQIAQLDSTVMVKIINQSETGKSIELDLQVDGIELKLSCSPEVQVCDFPLTPPCPQQVQALQENLLDAQGRFTGGRNFATTGQFNFTQGSGTDGTNFTCGSVIVFRFSDRTAEAMVL